ncbi:MAG: tetratricopeptide repeat protein [bacterium]|nr:tetratricopeptide repeat protein [bacterium]
MQSSFVFHSFRFRALVLVPILLVVAGTVFAAPVNSRVAGEAQIKDFPQETIYYIQYADFLIKHKAYKEAAEVLCQGKAQATPSADLLVKLGDVYQKQGLVAQAKTVTLEALRVDSSHVAAHVRLGEIYFQQGWHSSGLEYYKAAVALAPDEDLPKVRLVGGLCEVEQLTQAKDQCLEFISTKPQSPDLWLSLGHVFEKQDKRRQAFTTYGQVLTLDPENSLAYARQGRLFCEFGQFTSAETACRKALDLEPDNALGHAYLGIACAKLGQNDEARIHAEIAEDAGLNMVSVWKIIGN